MKRKLFMALAGLVLIAAVVGSGQPTHWWGLAKSTGTFATSSALCKSNLRAWKLMEQFSQGGTSADIKVWGGGASTFWKAAEAHCPSNFSTWSMSSITGKVGS